MLVIKLSEFRVVTPRRKITWRLQLNVYGLWYRLIRLRIYGYRVYGLRLLVLETYRYVLILDNWLKNIYFRHLATLLQILYILT